MLLSLFDFRKALPLKGASAWGRRSVPRRIEKNAHPTTKTGEGFPSPAGAARNNNQCYPWRLRKG